MRYRRLPFAASWLIVVLGAVLGAVVGVAAAVFITLSWGIDDFAELWRETRYQSISLGIVFAGSGASTARWWLTRSRYSPGLWAGYGRVESRRTRRVLNGLEQPDSVDDEERFRVIADVRARFGLIEPIGAVVTLAVLGDLLFVISPEELRSDSVNIAIWACLALLLLAVSAVHVRRWLIARRYAAAHPLDALVDS